MDLVAGSTAGRDRLRDRLRAPTTAVSDAQLQQLWDAAVGACLPYIRPGYTTNAPEQTIQLVVAVALHEWQAMDAAPGDVMPDGTSAAPFVITSNLVRRYLALGGDTVRTPKVAAGGTHTSGVLA